MNDRWLSVDEIAAYLGIKRDTVYKWIERKSMPAHKLGRLWKFRTSEIDDWVLANDTRCQEVPALCSQTTMQSISYNPGS